MTILDRFILFYYIILSFIDLSNNEYKFRRHAWSNDVITNPQEIKLTKENFEFAIKIELSTYDPEKLAIDLSAYFRLDFRVLSWNWETYEATEKFFSMKLCERSDI